jgi:hypothetical protein
MFALPTPKERQTMPKLKNVEVGATVLIPAVVYPDGRVYVGNSEWGGHIIELPDEVLALVVPQDLPKAPVK